MQPFSSHPRPPSRPPAGSHPYTMASSFKTNEIIWQPMVVPNPGATSSQSYPLLQLQQQLPSSPLRVSQYKPQLPASMPKPADAVLRQTGSLSAASASRGQYGSMVFKVSPQKPFQQTTMPAAPEKRPAPPPEEPLPGPKRPKIDSPAPPRRRERTAPKPPERVVTLPPMHIDALHQILLRAHPSVLVHAKLVCRDLNHLLKATSIWRDCRRNYYGDDLPGPPPGMEEWQYTDLISGNSCMKCGAENIRKKYWAFCRRWCVKCFKGSTLPETAVRSILTEHEDLRSCIISATVDGYGGYMCVELAQDVRRHRLYLNSDVRKIIVEFDHYRGTLADADDATRNDQIAAWIESKRESVQQLATHLSSIETWGNSENSSKNSKNAANKKAREKYFKEQAGLLTPPLHKDALELIPSYIRSIAICGPPSHSAWVHLEPKIANERTRAEEIVRIEAEIKTYVPSYWIQLGSIERTRDTYMPSEKRMVLDLAGEALSEMSLLPKSSAEVFTLEVLNRIWEKYDTLPLYQRPEPLGYGIEFFSDIRSTGRYVLSLQDLMMVCTQKIFPILHIDGESDKAPRFRCPGCTRKDMKSLLKLRDLFKHIRNVHARKDAGEFWTMRLGGFDHDRLYLTAIPWPRNLPILPPHQTASGTYDPNAVPLYKPVHRNEMVPTTSLEIPNNRRAKSLRSSAAGQNMEDDFIQDIHAALQHLHSTTLESPYQAKIAMKYALEIWSQNLGSEIDAQLTGHRLPSLSVLQNLSLQFIRNNDFTSFTGLRCGFCLKSNLKNNAPRVHGRLLEHLKNTRRQDHSRDDWANNLFAFPSDRALWDILSAPNMQDALAIYDTLFPVLHTSTTIPSPIPGIIAS